MGQWSYPIGSPVSGRANPLCGRFSHRSDPICRGVGEWRDLVSGRPNPISGGFSERPDSGGGGLRERPYSIGCGVNQWSNTISGRVDEILGGWRNLLSGGFRAAGTLRHVSSVVRNPMLPSGAFPTVSPSCVV
jgi:hypothetical protein